MERSPEWQGSRFQNPQPIVNDAWAAVVTLFRPDPNVKPRRSDWRGAGLRQSVPVAEISESCSAKDQSGAYE
jgi:hypothetical protein